MIQKSHFPLRAGGGTLPANAIKLFGPKSGVFYLFPFVSDFCRRICFLTFSVAVGDHDNNYDEDDDVVNDDDDVVDDDDDEDGIGGCCRQK